MSRDNKQTGPRGQRIVEKPKNFKNAISRLINELSNQKKLLIISCVLAMLGSVLSLIAPSRLSDLTDEISKGLIVKEENVTVLSKKIMKNLSDDNIKKVMSDVLRPNLNEIIINQILNSDDITSSDKSIFKNNLTKLKNGDTEVIKKLPDSILYKLFEDSEYDGISISKEDKIWLLKNYNDDLKNLNLPKSFQKIIFKNIKINGIEVNGPDQYKFLMVFNGLDKNSNPDVIYKKVDSLPSSVKLIIKPNMNIVRIKKITLFMVILYLSSAAFNFIQSLIMATLSNNFARNLRKRISKKINKLPLKYFDKHLSGDILSRVTNDVDTIAQTMNQSLASLVSSITLFVGSLVMMFVTNYIMAITAILSSLIGFVGMFFVLSKSQKYFKDRQVQLGNLNGHIEEVYSGLNIVKAYNGDAEADKKFDEYNKKVCESNKKSQFISGLMQPMMGFIGNFGYVAVCIVGALLTMNDVITFGVIVAFMTYVRLFTQPLSQIAQGMTSLQSASAASERVFEFIDEEEMADESDVNNYLDKSKVNGNISFENVVFKYDGKDKPTINNFTASVKKGQKIAIVGPTGAGKTTMVNLLMKFYDINSGEIKIDGVSIKNLTRENVHDLFTMVLQDTWIFEGSIKDNIKFNNNISDEDTERICSEIGLDHFIKTLPKGYDTLLSENDAVSAGQRQLLTIARAMTVPSPFVILDEATSNVDTRTEELVSSAMDKLAKGKTSFIIAHRLSTIKNADLILVMDGGNIIEQGTHDMLIKKGGFYAKLYNAQFESF